MPAIGQDYQVCPHCLEHNPLTHRVCSHCQLPLPAAPKLTISCPQCWEPNPPVRTVCWRCGAPLPPAEKVARIGLPDPSPQQPVQRSLSMQTLEWAAPYIPVFGLLTILLCFLATVAKIEFWLLILYGLPLLVIGMLYARQRSWTRRAVLATLVARWIVLGAGIVWIGGRWAVVGLFESDTMRLIIIAEWIFGAVLGGVIREPISPTLRFVLFAIVFPFLSVLCISSVVIMLLLFLTTL